MWGPSRPGGCRVGLCRHGFLWGWSDSAGRTRFRCVGTGVRTFWRPLWRHWRTPLCFRVHLGQGGKRCSGHSCSWGLRAMCSFVWWPSLEHSSAVLRSHLHVIHIEAECTEHFNWTVSGPGCVALCAIVCLRVPVYGRRGSLPSPIIGKKFAPNEERDPPPFGGHHLI